MFYLMERSKVLCFMFFVGIPLLALSLTGCGSSSSDGAPGTSSGVISGSVTNKTTGTAVAGATVSLSPAIEGVSFTTGTDGSYSGTLPLGTFTLTFSKENFASDTEMVVVGVTKTLNVALAPTSPVIVDAGADITGIPAGGTANLTATADVMDGSTIISYKWEQIGGVTSTISNDATAAATVSLRSAADYKTGLVERLVNLGNETGTDFKDRALKPHLALDRTQVLGINVTDRDEAAETEYKITVTTTSGTYTDTVKVSADISSFAAQTTGLQNVPINVPVLLHARTSTSGYFWTLSKPSGSISAALNDAATQNPYFTPDKEGKYTLTETISGKALDIYAAKWSGAVGSVDAGSGVTLSYTCATCHKSDAIGGALSVFINNFVPWSKSGHAGILEQQINSGLHPRSSCLECHALGYNTIPEAINNGFDDRAASLNFTYDTFISNGGKYGDLDPELQAVSNVQCENCHGPGAIDGVDVLTGGSLHKNGVIGDPERVSIAAEVCGSCHGKVEGKHHARYQMWQRSAHSNAARQNDTKSTNGSCSRCHTGEGFLKWMPRLQNGLFGNITAPFTATTKENMHPQTCAVCHDPHDTGTSSGKTGHATVRVSGDTPMLPAGFKASDVGSGAICIVCHNTRNGMKGASLGLHEDNDPVFGNLSAFSAPHLSSQGDVMMGRNAYFIGNNALRSRHSYIRDTCVNCHMIQTSAPSDLGLSDATNHTFIASTTMCGNCHGSFDDASDLQASVETQLEEVAAKMANYMWSRLPDTFYVKDAVTGSTMTLISKSNISSIEPVEAHGQQGFLLKFITPVGFSTGSLSEAEVKLGEFTKSTTATDRVIPVSDNLVKAGWNYYLIHSDGSKGVHNSSFVVQVLNLTSKSLD